jgi:hypothetical protein
MKEIGNNLLYGSMYVCYKEPWDQYRSYHQFALIYDLPEDKMFVK